MFGARRRRAAAHLDVGHTLLAKDRGSALEAHAPPHHTGVVAIVRTNLLRTESAFREMAERVDKAGRADLDMSASGNHRSNSVKIQPVLAQSQNKQAFFGWTPLVPFSL